MTGNSLHFGRVEVDIWAGRVPSHSIPAPPWLMEVTPRLGIDLQETSNMVKGCKMAKFDA